MEHALVTGTSRGLGAATARALLDQGWQVVGMARSGAPSELAGDPRYTHLRLALAVFLDVLRVDGDDGGGGGGVHGARLGISRAPVVRGCLGVGLILLLFFVDEFYR